MTFLFNPFDSPIRRSQWWLGNLIIFVLAIAGVFILAFLSVSQNPEGIEGTRTSFESSSILIIAAAAIYMNFSTCLNRLRTTGRSGLWYLTFLLPTVGTGLMIYFCGIETDGFTNAKSWQAVEREVQKPQPKSRSHQPRENQDSTQKRAAPRNGRGAPTFGRR